MVVRRDGDVRGDGRCHSFSKQPSRPAAQPSRVPDLPGQLLPIGAEWALLGLLLASFSLTLGYMRVIWAVGLSVIAALLAGATIYLFALMNRRDRRHGVGQRGVGPSDSFCGATCYGSYPLFRASIRSPLTDKVASLDERHIRGRWEWRSHRSGPRTSRANSSMWAVDMLRVGGSHENCRS